MNPFKISKNIFPMLFAISFGDVIFLKFVFVNSHTKF